jgi:multidrug efflux system outer membrane protein
MRRIFLSSVAAVYLAGCANVPPPQLPAGDIPPAFEQAGGKNAPLWPVQEWWNGFGDAQLSALMTNARANNLDIAQASARLRQADARAKQAGAPLLPSLGLNANLNTLYGQAKGTSLHETDWGAALGASYELDFWGKNRDALQSAEAARAASDADRATVGLTVSAGVANTYFQLLSLRERMDIARANLAASEDTLRVVQRRVDAGYAPASDLAQERANMAAQRAILPGLAQQELETRNTLAVLLGRPPEGLEITGASLAGLSGPVVVPGLPSELLARRPDVMAAEANLIAAHADLAAARTAFLPDITLTANGGLAYPALAAAIDTLPGTGLAAGIGASLVQSIFDNGKIQGRIDETKAREEELLAAYRAAAIAAFSDVENALGNLSHLADQEAALSEQAIQAEKVLAAARRKYSGGYVDFLVVTDAERTLNTARDQHADVHRARLTALVALYKALGGGWTRTGANAP